MLWTQKTNTLSKIFDKVFLWDDLSHSNLMNIYTTAANIQLVLLKKKLN
jgi:hypothetical protein